MKIYSWGKMSFFHIVSSYGVQVVKPVGQPGCGQRLFVVHNPVVEKKKLDERIKNV